MSQSLKPFRWYSRILTRFCLNRILRIYTRESRTSDLLRSLGVNPSRITLAPDIAFCLPAASDEAAQRFLPPELAGRLARSGQPVIGISVSCLMRDLSRKGGHTYLKKMARIVSFVRKRYGALVLLVPHVVTPRSWWRRRGRCD